MAKSFNDLTTDEKVQIAYAIIVLEGYKKPLDPVVQRFDLNKSVIGKIKGILDERLHEIFEPKQEPVSEDPDLDSILAQFSKTKISAPSSTPSPKSIAPSSSNELTEEMRDKLPEILDLIRKFNKTTDQPLKASPTVWRAALAHFGLLDKKSKLDVNNRLSTKDPLKEEVAKLSKEIDARYSPEKYPLKPGLTDFEIFLENLNAPSPDSSDEEESEESEEELAAAGGKSASKKRKRR